MMACRAWRSLLLGCLALAFHVDALACSMCLSAFKVEVGAQELGYASHVVLATQDHAQQYRVVAVIKGDAPTTGLIQETVARIDAADLQSRKPLLLIRDDKWTSWVSLGSIGADRADWLRKVAAAKASASATEDGQRPLVEVLLPSLQSSEPLVAKIAYSEIAAAPYAAMRASRKSINAEAVRRWLADPALSDRRSLYLLLIGIAGGPQDADLIETRLAKAWRANDATDLSAMLAADLELRGPSRMQWVESRYLLDPGRTPQEIRAALLALSEQGRVDATVPRARVIQAYRLFIRERKAMAGLVAQDLADWQAWDAVPEYVALLKSGAAAPVSRYAIVNYLTRSGSPMAKSALASLTDTPR